MSAQSPKLILEWAPSRVMAYVPGTGSTRTSDSVSGACDGMPTSGVLVALSRRTSFVRTTRVPNASHADVDLILRNQLGSLFPLSGNDLAYDFELTDDVTGEGRLALVAAIPADTLRQLQDECKAAGVTIAATVPAALGSVSLMHSMGVRDAAVVQVDEGGASIDVVTHGVLRYSRWTAVTRDVPGEVRRTFAAAGIEPLPILAAGGASLPADHHSSKSTLVGLGQIDLAKPPLNIELSETRLKRQAQAWSASLRTSAAVLVAGLAIASYVGWDRYTQIVNVNAKVDKQTKNANTQKRIADKAQSELTAAKARRDTVLRGFEPAQKFWEILAVITEDAPEGVWLSGISLERGKPFVIRGSATANGAVTAYSQELSGSDRLRDVRLVYTSNTSIDNRPVVLFNITGFATGNLPLVDPKKTTAPASTASTPSTSSGGGQG